MAEALALKQLIVTGAGGRIGRLLRSLWPSERVIWLGRAQWDILAQPAPELPHGAVWLDLAGVVRGDVAQNPLISTRVAEAAAARGGRVLYLSSAAVYPGGAIDMAEDMTAPVAEYGRSKLLAEAAVHAVLPQATMLRLGNLAGADAILGVDRGMQPTRLDPVGIGRNGPIRSYIGPLVLADVLWKLCQLAELPRHLNLAQPGEIAMGDLLTAAGKPWVFGPVNGSVIERVILDLMRLKQLIAIEEATADRVVADLRQLGNWPK